jgi:hypothetical protein
MSEPAQQPIKKTLFSRKGLLCLLFISLVAWIIIIWQNRASIWGVLQKVSWLLWVIGGLATLFIMAVITFWVFQTPDRRSQLKRLTLPVFLVLVSFGIIWVFKSITASTSSTSSDNFNNTMIAIFTIISTIFVFLTLIVGVLAILPRPSSPQRLVAISYTNNGVNPNFALWIQQQLDHEGWISNFEPCDHRPVSEVLKKIRQHVSQGEHVILALSPDHPLIQGFNRRRKLLLRWMQFYYRNMRERGEFIPVFTQECPEDKEKALLPFRPVNLADKNKEEAQYLLLKRITTILLRKE